MPERPLLFFSRSVGSSRDRRNPPRGGGLRLASVRMQVDRLTPQFDRLLNALENQRLVLQNNAFGLQPEQALVIETIGSVENFIRATRHIQGLEWLGEGDLDDIEPDFGFENEADPSKPLSGQLFLMMTDMRALNELLRMFQLWTQDSNVNFARGLAPLKQIFAQLRTIRPWNAEDRIRDTGILEDFEYRIQNDQQLIPFEAELWFRNDPDRRTQAEAYFQSVVESVNGSVVNRCTIPDIGYHALLGQIPISSVKALLQQTDLRLLQCQDVMYIRPVGQCTIRMLDDSELEVTTDSYKPSVSLPLREPIVALFDGLPLAGHQLLDGRLLIDDPDGIEERYQAHERLHGTMMASLICHGDLNEGSAPLDRQLYVRPIMHPVPTYDDNFEEAIPEDQLPLDLIHRSVRRLFEGEGEQAPVAPSIQVINLSVCDKSRPFDRGMSAWARLLDWLSWKYKVLFIVSAGNHLQSIKLPVPRTELNSLSPTELEQAVIRAIAEDTRHRRLLSPAETLNGVTVSALHTDASSSFPNERVARFIDPYQQNGLPSIVSAHGPGYRRSVKPDILLPGGRQPLAELMGNTHDEATLIIKNGSYPPGQRVAVPGLQGQIDKTIHTRGTSNAAALASRWSMYLYDTISQIWLRNGITSSRDHDVVLLKALLLHTAEWSDAGTRLTSVLRNSANSRNFRDYLTRFLGYGAVSIPKVMECTDQRVTVVGVGEISADQAHEYRLPLPPSLSATTERRRLTLTLAWLSPVNCLSQKYRIAHLWFNPANSLAPQRMCGDHNAVQRGTAQHEVLEGTQAIDYQDGEEIVIKINCRSEAGSIPEPIAYGLAVTLEVAEEVRLPVYEEVEARLRVRVAAG